MKWHVILRNLSYERQQLAKKSIGDLCSFTNGYGFSPSDWLSKGIPIMRIQNLNGSKEFNYFAGEVNEKWTVMPGDLLFAKDWFAYNPIA